MANDLYRIELTHRVESPQLGGEAILMTNGGMAFVTLHAAQDAVEVVRCKDCKSWEQYNACDGTKPHRCMNHDAIFYKRTAPNDFCSYGERKDNV